MYGNLLCIGIGELVKDMVQRLNSVSSELAEDIANRLQKSSGHSGREICWYGIGSSNDIYQEVHQAVEEEWKKFCGYESSCDYTTDYMAITEYLIAKKNNTMQCMTFFYLPECRNLIETALRSSSQDEGPALYAAKRSPISSRVVKCEVYKNMNTGQEIVNCSHLQNSSAGSSSKYISSAALAGVATQELLDLVQPGWTQEVVSLSAKEVALRGLIGGVVATGTLSLITESWKLQYSEFRLVRDVWEKRGTLEVGFDTRREISAPESNPDQNSPLPEVKPKIAPSGPVRYLPEKKADYWTWEKSIPISMDKDDDDDYSVDLSKIRRLKAWEQERYFSMMDGGDYDKAFLFLEERSSIRADEEANGIDDDEIGDDKIDDEGKVENDKDRKQREDSIAKLAVKLKVTDEERNRRETREKEELLAQALEQHHPLHVAAQMAGVSEHAAKMMLLRTEKDSPLWKFKPENKIEAKVERPQASTVPTEDREYLEVKLTATLLKYKGDISQAASAVRISEDQARDLIIKAEETSPLAHFKSMVSEGEEFQESELMRRKFTTWLGATYGELLETLVKHNGNRTRVAEKYDVTSSTVGYWIKNSPERTGIRVFLRVKGRLWE